MNRSILRKIAKENGVSVDEIRREMQAAIEAAYVNPNKAALSMPRKREVPTPEEFITHCVGIIKNKETDKFKY